MELKKLLVGIDGIKAKGDLDIDITSVESDSRKIKKGQTFVALKGLTVDGHDYISKAIENSVKDKKIRRN